MFDLVIGNAIIVSAANGYQPYIGSLAVRDGIIAYAGERQFTPRDAKTVLDYGGDIVMSGLVNGHCHAELSFMRGIGDDRTLLEQKQKFSRVGWFRRYSTEDERYAARQLTYCEALRSGTTFLNDNMYWSLGTRSVSAMAQTGIRGSLSEDIRPDFSCPDELASVERLQAFIEACKQQDILPVIAGPAEEDVTEDRLRRIAALCREVPQALYTCHLAENGWRMGFIREQFGTTPIELLHRFGLLNNRLAASHVVCASPQDICLLAESGAAVVNTPVCEMKIADGVAPIAEMVKQGVCVALGTDGPLWNNGSDLFREMKAMLLLQTVQYGIRSLTAKDVLNMATVNGAKAFHMQHRIGMLREGMEADFIRVSTRGLHMCPLRLGKYQNVTSLLVNNATGGDVRDVYIRGKCIVKNGRITTVDTDKLRHAVKACSDRVSQELAILRNF